ncbi:MAG: hypothetical protein ACTHJQ_24890 [Rhizobiaceae bacterium]
MKIEALIERLEGLTGPDREVDAEIGAHFGDPHGRREYVDYEARSVEIHQEIAEHYTASLDAAIALVGKVLPGWSGDVDICHPIADSGKVGARLFPPEPGWANYAGEGPTPAIALLISMFRALAAGGSDA